MYTQTIIEYLKKHGQLLDSEIAEATGIPISEVHAALAELAAQGEISKCMVTSYVNGKPIEGLQCRLSGHSPRPAPRYGRDANPIQRNHWGVF
jgi:predicted ArsR family transcriptional regulator